MNQSTGCVYLIGAGCGSMEFITLRGLTLLQQCDVVVYDDLIDEGLLDAAPQGAERIYMGKRSGKHSAPQAEISRVLVDQARMGKRVARLKGGDPFVFGRGGEEALALKAEGIPCEEVPGISSAIAIPAAAGIPVTHRGVSRSFHVITGHSADRGDGLPDDLELLAALHGTLVFLMGLSNLEKITAGLMAAGKDPETPAAVLSGGNSAHHATVRGILADIAEKTRAAEVHSPAVIVIGEVADMDLACSRVSPLSGVRVGLTGTDSMAEKLRPALEEQGAAVQLVERSVVDEREPELDLDELCDGRRRWLVFTSANGVKIFFRWLRRQRVDLRRFSSCAFAVIGSATGAVLEREGILADLCPDVYTSEELAKALCEEVTEGEEVILLRAKKGSAILPKMLKERGIPVQDIHLYDLHADPAVTRRSRGAVEELDYLTFSSGGGVELFFREHGALPEKAVCVCIGEVTAAALERRGCHDYVTAPTISARGIVEAILAHHGARTESEKQEEA